MRGRGRALLLYLGLARQALVPNHSDSRAVRRLAREMRAADRAVDRTDELIDRAGVKVARAIREATVGPIAQPDVYGRDRIVVILPGRNGFFWTGKLAKERDRLAKIYDLKPAAASAAVLLLKDRVRGCV